MRKTILAARLSVASMLRRFLMMTPLAFALASPAAVSSTLLDFEGIGDENTVSGFYNGGFDGGGHTGTNYGVRFSANATGRIEGVTVDFVNEPSPQTVVRVSASDKAYFDVLAGFESQISFYYSGWTGGGIAIYDDYFGTGNLLAALGLPGNFSDTCEDQSCTWGFIVLGFSGVARSVVLSSNFGADNDILFDNVKLGLDIDEEPPVASVPEPATWALMIAGFAGLGFAARRRAFA